MRANAKLVLEGASVLLVPYEKEHVVQYNRWMQDATLQELTGSEPLTLEEEYEMQRSWREDEKKLTFILLDPTLPDTEGTGQHGGGMAGDVNVYFHDYLDPGTGEIEVMVAEPQCRRKGIASEALGIMMHYGAEDLGVQRYEAKIKEHNAASIAMFEKLGYSFVSRSEAFGEVTYEYVVTPEARAALAARCAGVKRRPYAG
eukprot:tig00000640_g2777.t1